MNPEEASELSPIEAALLRQVRDERDHDLSLIDECLHLTADERLQRLTAWVDLISSARTAGPPPR